MDNCLRVTQQLLRSLRIDFTQPFLKDAILAHPDHPSLLCISDTLKKYQIENITVKTDARKLKEFPMPCIVQLSERGKIFNVLTKFTEHCAYYINDRGKTVSTPYDSFIKKWTGICLLAEDSEKSAEPGIQRKLTEQRTQGIVKWTSILFFSAWLFLSPLQSIGNNEEAIPIVLYFVLKVVGLFVGGVLLWYEIDQYHPSLQNFCSGGKRINCDSVLNSKKAKLFDGRISLGNLGAAYFFATLGSLVLSSFDSGIIGVTGLLSICTLPIILWSLYYQAIKLKQWCKLCLIVQGVLFVEIGLVFWGRFYANPLNIVSVLLLLGLFLVPILTWYWLKPILITEKDSHLHKRGLKKIKNNPNVLHGLLSKTRQIQHATTGLGIRFTNEGAKYNVVKVCNPYCGPCAMAHPILDALVQQGKINLQVLFTASTSENDIAGPPVRHLMAIAEQGSPKTTEQAMDDWYLSEKKNYETFAKKYPMNGELKRQEKSIEAMHHWCKAEKINHTPTLFINGHELPKEYRIDDLSEILTL